MSMRADGTNNEMGQPNYTQFEAIMGVFDNGQYHTHTDLAAKASVLVGYQVKDGSVASQLRNARVLGYSIDKRRISGTKIWEYVLVARPTLALGAGQSTVPTV